MGGRRVQITNIGFRGVAKNGGTLFCTKIGEDQKKKGLRCKINGFSVQKQVKTKKKKKGLRLKISGFLVQMRIMIIIVHIMM